MKTEIFLKKDEKKKRTYENRNVYKKTKTLPLSSLLVVAVCQYPFTFPHDAVLI